VAFVSRITADGGYAFDSASPRVAAAGFYVFTPAPVGEALIRFTTGSLRINLEWEGEDGYLIFQDGTNDLKVLLPFTEEQKHGNAWGIIKLRREGISPCNLIISLDKTELPAIEISHKTYGGVMTISEERSSMIFDPRVKAAAISHAATENYVDRITQDAGNQYLPNR